jgi:hypothetical protein
MWNEPGSIVSVRETGFAHDQVAECLIAQIRSQPVFFATARRQSGPCVPWNMVSLQQQRSTELEAVFHGTELGSDRSPMENEKNSSQRSH